MHSKKHTLSGPDHIQQFHNAHHHLANDGDHARTMWWEMGQQEPVERAAGGSVISQLRGGKKTVAGKREFGSHPAHGIPGIHIVGHNPVFSGEK